LHGTAREYDLSLRAVAASLGLVLHELADWNCCGATAARSLNESLALFLAARNLAMAERGPGPLLVPCNLCYSNLAIAAHSLGHESLRKRTNAALDNLGLAYSGNATVVHPLQALMRDVGPERIASCVTRPLRGLKVACYYGCLLTRPRYASIQQSNFNPVWLDNLVLAVGGSAVAFSSKTRCCGGPLLMTHPEAAARASGRILEEARDMGAQCIAVTCPMCYMSLSASQTGLLKRSHRKYRIAVLYFTQLLGLASGISPRELGLPSRILPL